MIYFFRKYKFYLGVLCLAQALSYALLFFSLWRKNKSLASAILAVSAVGGLAGAYLISGEMEKTKLRLSALDALCNEYLISENETVCHDDDTTD